MRLPLIASALVAATILSSPTAAQREQGVTVFRVALEGEQEVPVAGDPDGSGTAVIRVNPRKEQVCYTIKVKGIALPVTAAHIHEAPAGDAGSPVVTLSPPTGTACVSTTRAQALEIISNPANFYVNVHNTPYSGGALRGQLS